MAFFRPLHRTTNRPRTLECPTSSLCPGGVIGSRKGLKIPRRKLHTGSSPVPGTNLSIFMRWNRMNIERLILCPVHTLLRRVRTLKHLRI
jgi:hypothetical protein